MKPNLRILILKLLLLALPLCCISVGFSNFSEQLHATGGISTGQIQDGVVFRAASIALENENTQENSVAEKAQPEPTSTFSPKETTAAQSSKEEPDSSDQSQTEPLAQDAKIVITEGILTDNNSITFPKITLPESTARVIYSFTVCNTYGHDLVLHELEFPAKLQADSLPEAGHILHNGASVQYRFVMQVSGENTSPTIDSLQININYEISGIEEIPYAAYHIS